MMHAPGRDRFVPYPASWYRFGDAGELRDRPITKTILGRPLVAFRTQRGQLAVLSGFGAGLTWGTALMRW